jgi:hypothetical protein
MNDLHCRTNSCLKGAVATECSKVNIKTEPMLKGRWVPCYFVNAKGGVSMYQVDGNEGVVNEGVVNAW